MAKTAWTKEQHLQRYGNNFNSGLANFVNKTFETKKIIEFGCGVGWYCDFFSKNGAEIVYGIEPNRMDENCFNNINCFQLELDLTVDSLPKECLETKFDLFWSVEVMEHIHRDSHTKLFDLFASLKAKNVVFSGARIGQGGHGHIACRDELDWRKEWTSRGYVFNEGVTNLARKASNRRNVNHIRNIQIFNLP